MSEVIGELKFRVEIIILEAKAQSREYQLAFRVLASTCNRNYLLDVLATRVITCINRDI